ncbi:unnamed protein product [Protopolystoma xenopodis]|uniref:Tetraspanin n=1 Tax=Protopolystoma xenopodis TaxID=117903 RepID=A0A3S5ARY5_9PLAT|nr:unnamed protein product [Protopolystoma xenopodis]
MQRRVSDVVTVLAERLALLAGTVIALISVTYCFFFSEVFGAQVLGQVVVFNFLLLGAYLFLLVASFKLHHMKKHGSTSVLVHGCLIAGITLFSILVLLATRETNFSPNTLELTHLPVLSDAVEDMWLKARQSRQLREQIVKCCTYTELMLQTRQAGARFMQQWTPLACCNLLPGVHVRCTTSEGYQLEQIDKCAIQVLQRTRLFVDLLDWLNVVVLVCLLASSAKVMNMQIRDLRVARNTVCLHPFYRNLTCNAEMKTSHLVQLPSVPYVPMTEVPDSPKKDGLGPSSLTSDSYSPPNLTFTLGLQGFLSAGTAADMKTRTFGISQDGYEARVEREPMERADA